MNTFAFLRHAVFSTCVWLGLLLTTLSAATFANDDLSQWYTNRLTEAGKRLEASQALSSVLAVVDSFARDDVSLGLLESFVPGLADSYTINTMLPSYAYQLRSNGIYIGGLLNSDVFGFFRVFSVALFFLTLSVSSYTAIAMVLDSSMDGNPMGRMVGNRFYIAFRTVVTFTAFFPLPPQGSSSYMGGFSLAQSLLHGIAVFGVFLANTLWALIVAGMLWVQGGIGDVMLSQHPQEVFTQEASSNSQLQQQNRLIGRLNEQITAMNTAERYTQSPVMALLASVMCARAHAPNGRFALPTNAIRKIQGSMVLDPSMQADGSCGVFAMVYPSDLDAGSNRDLLRTQINNYARTLLRQLVQASENIPSGYFTSGACQGVGLENPAPDSACHATLQAGFGPSGVLTQNGAVGTVQTLVQNSVASYHRFLLLIAPLYNQPPDSGDDPFRSPAASLLQGGWALASNNYMYFAPRMSQQKFKNSFDVNNVLLDFFTPSSSNFCIQTSINNAICLLLFPGGNPAYRLNMNIPTLDTQKVSKLQTNEDVSLCSTNPENCKAFLSQFGTTRASDNTFMVGQALLGMFANYRAVKPAINPSETFRTLAEGRSPCNVAYAGTECRTEKSMFTTITSSADWAVGLLARFMGMNFGTILIGHYSLGLPWVVIYPTIAALNVASSFVYDILSPKNPVPNLFNNTQHMLSPEVEKSVYALVYLTVEAWYESFISNRTQLFLHPIYSLSRFGFTILQTTTAFLIRVGIEMYAQSFSVSFDFFMRKLRWTIIQSTTMKTFERVSQLGYYIQLLSIPGPTNNVAKFQSAYDRFTNWNRFIGTPFFGETIGNLLNAAGIAYYTLSLSQTTVKGISLIMPPPFNAPPQAAAQILRTSQLIITRIANFAGDGVRIGAGIGIGVTQAALSLQLSNYNDIFLGIWFLANEMWAPVYYAICIPLITISTMFSYYLPIYPSLIFSFSVLGWLLFYLEAVLATPLILLGLSNPKGHPLLGSLQNLMMMLLAVALKPAMIILGFLLSNAVASLSVLLFYMVAFPFLESRMLYFRGVAAFGGGDAFSAIIVMLMVATYVYMMFQMMVFSYALTYQVPSTIMRWLGLQPDQGEEYRVAKEISQQFKDTSEQTASAGKSVSEGMANDAKRILNVTRGG